MFNEDLPLIEFTAFSRCDACGAQALSMARHEEMGEFLFCLHHRKEHKNRLLEDGWVIIDGTVALELLADNEGVPV